MPDSLITVVLGGDTPLALPLILGLEKRGFVVIASVSTPEAVEILERRCQGYVRALVLDPYEACLFSITTSIDPSDPSVARHSSRIPALFSLHAFPQVPHHSCRRPIRIAHVSPVHPLRHLSFNLTIFNPIRTRTA